jgi:hypothetical protein
LLGAVAAAMAATTATALAAKSPGLAAATGCVASPKAVPAFASFGDSNGYVLTAGGGFEPGTPGWSLSGGAGVISGNAPDPFAANGDGNSLYLPDGASATSACTTNPNIEPVVRLWAKSATRGSRLEVEVLVNGGTYWAGTATAGKDWAPTAPLVSDAPANESAVQYQVRLTAIGGAFTVDDVYVDPWCRF